MSDVEAVADAPVAEFFGALSAEYAANKPGLVAALARAQGKFPPIVKSHINPAFKGSQYADVADVLAAVRPVLAAEGIAVTQSTRIGDEGGVILETTLEYAGDEDNEMRSEFPLYVAGLTAQQVGSLMTYHRRYQLCAILGVHPVGDDDDGNLAATAPPARLPRERVSDAQVDSYALAAANPPEKPLAAMTAGEMARYGESIGVRVTGTKADILRTLEPYIKAASGAEPWPVEGEGEAGDVREAAATNTNAAPSHPEPAAIPFDPVVVAPPLTDVRHAKPSVRDSIRRGAE